MRPYRLASTESSEADESSDEEYRRRGITTSYNLSIFNSFFIHKNKFLFTGAKISF